VQRILKRKINKKLQGEYLRVLNKRTDRNIPTRTPEKTIKSRFWEIISNTKPTTARDWGTMKKS